MCQIGWVGRSFRETVKDEKIMIARNNFLRALAYINRCMDLGRDRIFNRYIAPLVTAISISTWLKVMFPKISITNQVNILLILTVITLISWYIGGWFWQRYKILAYENDFDFLRIPMFVEILNAVRRIEKEVGNKKTKKYRT